MGIPNESVTENEIEEKRRQEAREEFREEQRRKAEKSLDRGTRGQFSRLGSTQYNSAGLLCAR